MKERARHDSAIKLGHDQEIAPRIRQQLGNVPTGNQRLGRKVGRLLHLAKASNRRVVRIVDLANDQRVDHVLDPAAQASASISSGLAA